MRIATATSLTGSGTGCMTTEHKQTGHLCNLRKQVAIICPRVSSEEDIDLHECLDKRKLSSDRRRPSLSVEDQSYSASFHHGANEWLTFWLFLVASSYFLLSKKVNAFSGFEVKTEEKVSLSNRSIRNARTENDAAAENDMFSCSESSGSSHRTSSMNSWTGLCTECDVYSEISDLDRASYWHSLLSLEEEDSEWLSDSMTYECSSENPSTPLSYKYDSFTEISDIDTPSYWDSLLRLEGEDSEWISESKQELEYVRGIDVLSPVTTISSSTGAHCGNSEDNISTEHLLETADIEEFSADEPLFWPLEGKFNWDSEEPWSSFCTSPRRSFVFDSRSTTSRIKGCKQKGDEALYLVNSETSRLSTWSKCSADTVTSGCKDEKVALKRGEVQSNKLLSFSKNFLNEDFYSNMDLPLEREYFALDHEFPIETLVGLKEFDGHEGLDSEFIGDVFVLEESLQ